MLVLRKSEWFASPFTAMTVSNRRQTGSGPGRSAAQLRRDVVLARVARARRATIVGAGALTAALAAAVAVVAPGRSSANANPSSSTSTTTKATHGGATMPPLASASQLGLQGPDSAPQAPEQTQTQAQPTQTQTQAAPPPAAPVSGGS